MMAFDATARHLHPANNMDYQPPYYLSLMARNGILFWLRRTPALYRRFLRQKLPDRSFYLANILSGKGRHDKTRACLPGTLDGMPGHGGKPRLLELLRMIMLVRHGKHIAARQASLHSVVQ